MSGHARGFRSILLWSYERGTLQYDIICALILAFVFLVPPGCFVTKKIEHANGSNPNTQYSSPDNSESEQPLGATKELEKAVR